MKNMLNCLTKSLGKGIMVLFRYLTLLILGCSLSVANIHAKNKNQFFYRDFWYPTYLMERLDYCDVGGKTCGSAIATRYCQMMGYATASDEHIDYNVGVSHYLSSRFQCKGWRCNGFKWITCQGVLTHQPKRGYFYRLKRYVFPQFDHYRVAWCYKRSTGCGKRAAFSFCRRMGYSREASYVKQIHVAATQALGDQQLCFGPRCEGFSEITCYR